MPAASTPPAAPAKKILPLAAAAIVVVLVILLLVRQNAALEQLQTELTAATTAQAALQQEIQTIKARPVAAPTSGSSTGTTTASSADAKVAPLPSEPKARPGVTITPPTGWIKNGRNSQNYTVGVDSTELWGGMPSAYVESHAASKDGFGGMMQTTAATNYAGKRVRLNAWIKTSEANDGGGRIWLRVDGQQRGQSLGFDNMENRAVRGTNDWQEASIVLDVPADASSLNYGFFVQGEGKMWVNGQTITEVGPDVPTTNMITPPAERPTAPVNLGFNPSPPK